MFNLFRRKKKGYIEKKYGTGATLESLRESEETPIEESNESNPVTFFNAKEKGDYFENECVQVLLDSGFDVIHRGKELGVKDGGIDIVAYLDKYLFLIQCKNYKQSTEITDKELRIFYADYKVYVDENDTSDYEVMPIYLTRYYQLAYSGKYWLEGKNLYYMDYEAFLKLTNKEE